MPSDYCAEVVATMSESKPMERLKKHTLVEALADAMADLTKSYFLAEVCDQVGLPPHPDPKADPFISKRVYVRSRAHAVDFEGVIEATRNFLRDYDDDHLEGLLALHRPDGHGETVKNLVFGSTVKPDLVLLDALSNDLGLVNDEHALLYDSGIPDRGLSWEHLVKALLAAEASQDLLGAGRRLHHRLESCLASIAERNLFRAYAERYGQFGFDQPALIPQVWLHYDPKSARQRNGHSPLARQRMDFLLLLEGGRRVVLEVDGKQHYCDQSGKPSPEKYAEMVAADRELKLAGYEVYRFGGAELMNLDATRELTATFFPQLLEAP